MSQKIDRRTFFERSALSSAGILLGGMAASCSGSRGNRINDYDVITEMMKYRKIDAHEHVDLYEGGDWEYACKSFRNYPNIYVDTSGRAISNMGELLKKFGNSKFSFGTHSSILDYVSGRLRIESLRTSEADDMTRELLRSGNARRILGI